MSQQANLKDTSVIVSIPYAPASIQISKDTSTITFTEVTDHIQLLFQKVDPGPYSVILMRGLRTVEVLRSLYLKDTVSLLVQFENIGPCLYDHPKGYLPRCPFGDSQNILPVISGLPTPEDLNDAKNGKVKLTNCTVDPCSPRFYCTTHQTYF